MTRSSDYTSGSGSGGSRGLELALRVLALLLTLAATIVMGVEKQTQSVPITLAPGFPPLNVSVTAKSLQVSALVYFVVANAIAGALTLLSILLTLMKKNRTITFTTINIFTDVITVALLFSAVGASSGVGWIGMKGNSHLRWNKICNVFGKYCHGLFASIVLCFLASLIHVMLVMIAARNLGRVSASSSSK